MDIALRIKNVSVRLNGRRVLEDISFEVPRGARLAVVGPNGAGKSTLFRAIAGLLPLEKGEIELLDGRGPAEVGYLPQRAAIDLGFPVTVFDVVMMGRVGKIGWLRWYTRRDRDIALAALARVGMREYADRPIGELSGGQQQRVFIARALAQEAKILLMDEPFSGLDIPAQESILQVMDDLRRQGITVLFATHDLTLTVEHFDLIALLNGRLFAFGPPREVINSDNLALAYGVSAVWRGENYAMVLGDIGCCGEAEKSHERD